MLLCGSHPLLPAARARHLPLSVLASTRSRVHPTHASKSRQRDDKAGQVVVAGLEQRVSWPYVSGASRAGEREKNEHSRANVFSERDDFFRRLGGISEPARQVDDLLV